MSSRKPPKFSCKSESQKKAIRRSYAQLGQAAKSAVNEKNKSFPNEFPFWARFRKNKNRTTLIIDEEVRKIKDSDKSEELFVHREATHTKKKDYEEIDPNPDKDDPKPMYLKRPSKHPKRMFEPHNRNLDMPEEIQKRYEKNNKK